jgi:hypothetical protein
MICNTPNVPRQQGAGDFARFNCPRCGSFALSGTAENSLERLLAEVPLRRSLSRLAFMAMKFGLPQVDIVVEKCFKPAVVRTGFELRKLTDQQPAGLIDDQIRAALLSARFVIADLTHGSHGAYWEAGYAEGLGLPVIYTCQKSEWDIQKTHFDTSHLVTIIWDEADLRRAEDALAATIRATLRAEAKQDD